jgi:4-hydroxythreonine-4-phosphate dehydrogenase
MKIDSLLRGPVAALVAALATPERVVVVAPALPGIGRTTVGGVVRVGGVPLAETEAWAAEPAPPPTSVAAALSPLECVSLGLDRVRGDALSADLGRLRGRVAVCDAETTDDLLRIAAATRRVLPAAAFGASALCRAFFHDGQAAASAPLALSRRPCLIVVGTAVPAAVDQVAILVRETGTSELTPAAGELVTASKARLARWRRAIEEALALGDVVLRFSDRPGGHTPTTAASVLATLVAQCAPVTSGAADLILTGGQTARTILDALGVTRFTIATEVGPGAIISELPSGALLGTRPGSFGGLHSLLELRLAMGPAHTPDPMRSQP